MVILELQEGKKADSDENHDCADDLKGDVDSRVEGTMED